MALTMEDVTMVPIASLSPDTPHNNGSIRAIVTLLWPYSMSTKRMSLLLAEPDFRLRKLKGQVRVQLHGLCAQELARSHVGIGDEVVLSLEGASWTEPAPGVFTPGRSIDSELVYMRNLDIQITRDQELLAHVRVDGDTQHDQGRSRSATPDSPALLTPARPYGIDLQVKRVHTPIFHKRARVSSGSLVDSPYDPFQEDENEIDDRHRKRARRSWGGDTKWKVTRRDSPPASPFVAGDGMDIEGLLREDEATPERSDTATQPPNGTAHVQAASQSPPRKDTFHDGTETAQSFAYPSAENGYIDHSIEVEIPQFEVDDLYRDVTPEQDFSQFKLWSPQRTPTPPYYSSTPITRASTGSNKRVRFSLDNNDFIEPRPHDEQSSSSIEANLEPEVESPEVESDSDEAEMPDEFDVEEMEDQDEAVDDAMERPQTVTQSNRPEEQMEEILPTAPEPEPAKEPPPPPPRIEMPPPPLPAIRTTNLQASSTPSTLFKTPLSALPGSPRTPELQPLHSASLPLPSPFPGDDLTNPYAISTPATPTRAPADFSTPSKSSPFGIVPDWMFQFGFGADMEETNGREEVMNEATITEEQMDVSASIEVDDGTLHDYSQLKPQVDDGQMTAQAPERDRTLSDEATIAPSEVVADVNEHLPVKSPDAVEVLESSLNAWIDPELLAEDAMQVETTKSSKEVSAPENSLAATTVEPSSLPRKVNQQLDVEKAEIDAQTPALFQKDVAVQELPSSSSVLPISETVLDNPGLPAMEITPVQGNSLYPRLDESDTTAVAIPALDDRAEDTGNEAMDTMTYPQPRIDDRALAIESLSVQDEVPTRKPPVVIDLLGSDTEEDSEDEDEFAQEAEDLQELQNEGSEEDEEDLESDEYGTDSEAHAFSEVDSNEEISEAEDENDDLPPDTSESVIDILSAPGQSEPITQSTSEHRDAESHDLGEHRTSADIQATLESTIQFTHEHIDTRSTFPASPHTEAMPTRSAVYDEIDVAINDVSPKRRHGKASPYSSQPTTPVSAGKRRMDEDHVQVYEDETASPVRRRPIREESAELGSDSPMIEQPDTPVGAQLRRTLDTEMVDVDSSAPGSPDPVKYPAIDPSLLPHTWAEPQIMEDAAEEAESDSGRHISDYPNHDTQATEVSFDGSQVTTSTIPIPPEDFSWIELPTYSQAMAECRASMQETDTVPASAATNESQPSTDVMMDDSLLPSTSTQNSVVQSADPTVDSIAEPSSQRPESAVSPRKSLFERTKDVSTRIGTWFSPRRSVPVALQPDVQASSLSEEPVASSSGRDAVIDRDVTPPPEESTKPIKTSEMKPPRLKQKASREELDFNERVLKHMASQSSQLSRRRSSNGIGFRTSHAYFSALSELPSHINTDSPYDSKVDVLAVVCKKSASPKRADKGPRDYFTQFRIIDPSISSSQGTTHDTPGIRAQVFRPYKASLPHTDVGDVVLLRNFDVVSQSDPATTQADSQADDGTSGVILRSCESSSWCVWHFAAHAHDTAGHRTRSHDKEGAASNKPIWAVQDYKDIDAAVVKAEQVSGPPVELGSEERQVAVDLAKWYHGLGEGESLDEGVEANGGVAAGVVGGINGSALMDTQIGGGGEDESVGVSQVAASAQPVRRSPRKRGKAKA